VSLQRAFPIGHPSWITDLHVEVRLPGQEELISRDRVRTDEEGYFYFYVADPGYYDIGVKSAHALENKRAQIEIVPGYNPNVFFGTLLEGDADDSNRVDLADYALLRERFWRADARTDLNQDGITGILDYSLLYSNYGLAGPRLVEPEPPDGMRPADSTVTATIAIASAVVAPGQVVELPIYVDVGSGETDGVEVHLSFDPAWLRVVDANDSEATAIREGAALANVLGNAVSHSAGTIAYAAGSALEAAPTSGSFLLGTIRVKASAQVEGTTSLSCYAAAVARAGARHPVRVTNGLVQITSESATPAPTATPQTPKVTVTPQRGRLLVPLLLKIAVLNPADAEAARSEEARGQEPWASLSGQAPTGLRPYASDPLVQLTYPLVFRNFRPVSYRFGVNVAPGYGSISDYDLSQLGRIGWYHDWSTKVHAPRPGGIEFAQTIRLRDDPIHPELDYWPPAWGAIEAAIRANSGALWFIGNEPDRADFVDGSPAGQDNCLPHEYAERYHACYTFIKSRDPRAQVSAAAIVQPSALRLRWLDLVLDAYQARYGQPMPVDVWNIHVQILHEMRGSYGCEIPPGLPDDQGELWLPEPSVNADVFRDKIVLFRTWMRDRGQRQKPLVISEYGVVWPSGYGFLGGRDKARGDQMVIDFMRNTFDYCLNATDPALGYSADGDRLVQRWAWYSLNMPLSDFTVSPPDITNANGSLYDSREPQPRTPTHFGVAYRDYTQRFGY